MTFDPSSNDAVFAKIIARLDAQNEQFDEFRKAVLGELKEIRYQTTKTNGNVIRHDAAIREINEHACPSPGSCVKLREELEVIKMDRAQESGKIRGAQWVWNVFWTIFGSGITAAVTAWMLRP